MAGTSWTLNEVSSFLKLKPHKLFPLLHSGEWPPEELYVECSRIEEVKLSSGFETAMERLIKSIKSKIHASAAAKAVEEPAANETLNGDPTPPIMWTTHSSQEEANTDEGQRKKVLSCETLQRARDG